MKISPAIQSALDALQDEPVTGRDKGLPNVSLRLGELGKQAWNILRGDVPLPAMVIRWADVEHNIRLMQDYCDRHSAWLAPHGKTTMAPQIFAAQLAAGSWAITVANIPQVQVARSFGMDRMLLANEAINDYDARYLARELRDYPSFEPYVLVDSQDAIDRLARALDREPAGRPLNVLVELGMPGGRCGIRTVDEARALAEAVVSSGGRLRLAGVEGYEGIAPGATHGEAAAGATDFLKRLAQAARAIRPLASPDSTFIVTAGGSMFFDLVAEHLGQQALPEAQLVLRAGGYVTHDSVHYAQGSPLGAHLGPADPAGQLRPALEIWATVLSRPEPDLAILSMGKRDVPVDLDMPVPLYRSRAGAVASPLGEGFQIFKVNDQHAYLRLALGADVSAGDLVGCGISHPCTAFDKWRLLLTVDEARNVIGGIKTFF
jgi:D-serine dehydratase